MARDGAKAGAGVNGDSSGGTQWVTEEPARRPAGGRGARDGHPGVPRGGDVDVGAGGGAYGDVNDGRAVHGGGAHGVGTHGGGAHGGGTYGDGTHGGGTHGRTIDGHHVLGDATNGHAAHEDPAHEDPTHEDPSHGDHAHEDHAHKDHAHEDHAHHNGTHGPHHHADATRRGAALSTSTHGCVTRLRAALGEAAWGGAPWGPAGAPNTQGGAPKRPGETLGPGAKRPKLEVAKDEEGDTKDGLATGLGQVPVPPPPPLRDLPDVKDEPEDLSDTGSYGSPPGPSPSPGCSPPRSDGALEPPWAACAGGSSEDEAPPEPPPGLAEPPPGRPHLRFEISSEDGLSVSADTIDGAWRAVIEKVQEARAHARLKQLSFAGMSGLRLLGMHHDAVLFLVEQLPGAGACPSYRFRYHPRGQPLPAPPRNPSGCARAELYVRKCTFDMFSFLASQHRTLPEGRPRDDEEDEVQLKPTRRATSLELPMAMRFRHLKRTSKEAVGVYRSAIHGRGLFCKRNIDAGEMVIEYSGIVVRSVLTDKREKFYDSKGIGCYMFRIDDAEVVDATMHGSAARFINHSCEPNCYSRVIHVEGHKRIVIFALRRILRGEELTYDYKFPIEEPAAKLPCNCGAKRCRRFLN